MAIIICILTIKCLLLIFVAFLWEHLKTSKLLERLVIIKIYLEGREQAKKKKLWTGIILAKLSFNSWEESIA